MNMEVSTYEQAHVPREKPSLMWRRKIRKKCTPSPAIHRKTCATFYEPAIELLNDILLPIHWSEFKNNDSLRKSMELYVV